jgi:hypothetical protein
MTIDQVSVFVENRSGRLAEICEILGGAGVDLRAMSIADSVEFGILRVIVSEPEKAVKALGDAGVSAKLTQVVAVALKDEPGSLASILRTLADGDVNVEYMYAFISRKAGNAYVVLRVADTDKAAQVLAGSGVQTVSKQDIFDL